MSEPNGSAVIDGTTLRRLLSPTEQNVLRLLKHATPREVAREMGWGDSIESANKVRDMKRAIEKKVTRHAEAVRSKAEAEPVVEDRPAAEPEPERADRGAATAEVRSYLGARRGSHVTPGEVAAALGMKAEAVAQRMHRLALRGELERPHRGVYVLPPLPVPGSAPDPQPEAAPEQPESPPEPEAVPEPPGDAVDPEEAVEEAVPTPVRLISVPLPVEVSADRLAAARIGGVTERDVYLAILLDLVQRPGCADHIFDRLERMIAEAG